MLVGVGWKRACEAQDYPTRPISMIVPFPAGGATDNVARFLGEKMRVVLGQPIVIENVGGAAGSLGATGRLTGISERDRNPVPVCAISRQFAGHV
jgi:tripartite-type tricarboxylate transporter receptor subunit TctC